MSQESLLEWTPPPDFRFNGPEYIEADDRARLTGQLLRVRAFMLPGHWKTVSEIAAVTGDPETSVSAQLRNLRKARFGSYIVERRAKGDRMGGLYEFRLLCPDVEDVPAEARKTSSQIIAELRAEVSALRAELARVGGL